MEGFITIELSNEQAELMAMYNKYAAQFKKLVDKKIFEPEFTGQIICDIKDGQIKNLKRDETFHY